MKNNNVLNSSKALRNELSVGSYAIAEEASCSAEFSKGCVFSDEESPAEKRVK